MTVEKTTDALGNLPRERPVYLDYAATSPVDPRVAEEVMRFMTMEFGNAGSRTHSYGQVAKQRVNRAREEVAAVVDAQPDEVIFTSGATESNNIAILGLAAHGETSSKRHIISTRVEHKAVLEPLAELERRGFDVDLLPPDSSGWVSPESVADALRPDTLLVSVMAVNNETGVVQPTGDISAVLAGHTAFFHVDGAQAFGKLLAPLRSERVDLISISGHKIGAPKGVGALIARRRQYRRVPLAPIMFGGGQERALRPGTLPVPLIAGLGTAANLCLQEATDRALKAQATKVAILEALTTLGAKVHGDPAKTLPSIINISIPGVDSEASIVALKDLIAISNGSACTSSSYSTSHVLEATGMTRDDIASALRISWGADSPELPLTEIVQRLAALQAR